MTKGKQISDTELYVYAQPGEVNALYAQWIFAGESEDQRRQARDARSLLHDPVQQKKEQRKKHLRNEHRKIASLCIYVHEMLGIAMAMQDLQRIDRVSRREEARLKALAALK